jgi:4-aminobutyrate aminotransferase/(S)-3-amino-2-methylpropionate transaminase
MEATQAVTAAALKRGVIALRAGLFSNCVRLLPPLDIDDALVDEGMATLSAAVDDAVLAMGAARP